MKKLTLLLPILLMVLWPVHAQTAHNITLTWTASSGVPVTYNIKRGVSAGTETLLATVPAPTVTYVDTAGVGGVTYFYVVSASNSAGESANSNEVSATFLADKPGAPTGLGAVAN